MKSAAIRSDPEVLRGRLVFEGTRVPIEVLFDHLEAGDNLEVFLDDFPSVTREQALQLLEDARTALVAGNDAAA